MSKGSKRRPRDPRHCSEEDFGKRWGRVFGVDMIVTDNGLCMTCGLPRPDDDEGWRHNFVICHPTRKARFGSICPKCFAGLEPDRFILSAEQIMAVSDMMKVKKDHLARQKKVRKNIKGFLKGKTPKIQGPPEE